ncbi:DNA polymerase III subunit alpha [Mycoplasmopsis mucosicanis]|uniref:DNA-directed DNA polymerase n=1 Tax=Mycoplasmopsis mucosicanis TaxID=458208 RepID=A0A507SUZ1_9BACT|nr:DNA polymerase III subunit alpha [Mycoplasmopsis mucosicanis]TQC54004.1 DNA polymerase III subunit alpha [Mycoplasmopsis mucosicanis]
MKKFINLYNTTEYSFLDSLIRVDELVKQSKQNGLDAVILSDHNNLFGLGSFLKYCSQYNIKPIVGVDLDVDNYRFILLAKNLDGFQKINELILARSQNKSITFDQLCDTNIFVLDHPQFGIYAQTKQNFQINSPNYFVCDLDSSIPNALFYRSNQLFDISQNDTLNIIQQLGSHKLSNQTHNYFDEITVNSVLLDRIYSIIDQCNFKLEPKKLNLAKFENNDDETNEKILVRLLTKGLENIKNELPTNKNIWHQRVNYEFETIKSLGFINYFLIIQDLVNWAKSKNIAIGPGRGSAAGSFISYLLNITAINPLKYDLLFERFLNPGRVSWPDIDIDIQDDRRFEVFDYIKEKYGFENVALISTFQTLGAKMAIRDVGRVLGIDLTVINAISKTLGANETLNEALQKNIKFQLAIEPFQPLLKHALIVEGLPRQQSYHPAGIIVARQKITNYAPCSLTNDGSFQQVQLSMDYVEDFGLLKIDLLGLKTLTELQHIEQNLLPTQKFDFLLKQNPLILNDQKTFLNLNLGFTEGIFQLESPGMNKTIKKIKINAFDDLYAIISLFRPGPLAYINEYAFNKENPNLVKKIHPAYDEILASTYGIMVYQEQIMMIAQKVANMSFVEADFLRRAISKKDDSKIKQYKETFINGALKNGLSMQQVNQIYANIERFAEYGFNKSHAVSYAYLTMKMAYYKTYYPLHFYTALITNSRGDQAKIAKYVEEIKKQRIIVNSPDILHSTQFCTIKNNQIYLPFDLIKGFGQEGVNKIMSNIAQWGPFNQNLNETILRLRHAGITESLLNLLIRSNVFRAYGHMKFIENATKTLLDCYKLVAKNTWEQARQKLQKSGYLDIIHDDVKRDINYEATNEISLLGMTFNASPTSIYEAKYEFNLNTIPVGYSVYVVAQLTAKRVLNGKNFFVIELSDSNIKQTFYPSLIYLDKWSIFKPGDILEAKIENKNHKLLLRDLKPL